MIAFGVGFGIDGRAPSKLRYLGQFVIRGDLWRIMISNLFYDVLIEEVETRTKIELDGLNLCCGR